MDLGSAALGFMMHSPNSDSIFAVRVAFASTTDYKNSEDWSSKSSTAASTPKVRYDIPARKGIAGSSKKARGVRVKIEKENSDPSIESDPKSSNFIFTQGPVSVISN
ncbi:hypothetical protein V6N13_039750 [Hibiscus sabdariffa]|uniref:Uncharacterized protein n=1 Tax=Hibiscus sabdariffa TaxID=183260 RepID=A0ABR2SUT9_9ROSI